MTNVLDPKRYRVSSDAIEFVDLDELDLHVGGKPYREVDALAESVTVEMGELSRRIDALTPRGMIYIANRIPELVDA